MRVLHVIPSISPVHGGPSRAIVDMERALSAAGIEVTTLTTDDDGPGRRYRSGPPSPVEGVQRIYRRKLTEFYKVAPGLVPWLAGNVRRFDVVHVHALFSFSSVAAAAVAGLRGVPYVVRPLGTLSTYGLHARRPSLKRMSMAIIERRILLNASAVQFTSEDERRDAETLGIAMHSAVIPLGVAPLSLPPVPDGPRDTAAHRCATVLFMSRLDPKKNLEGLLHAMAALRERSVDAVLEVAGAGTPSYERELLTLASNLGISDRVRWLGHVDGDAKVSALARADLYVLPSHSENFGIAPVEAMQAGLPCLLGSGVAISRDAEHAGACLTTELAPANIADAVRKLLEDEPARRRMGLAARSFVSREYSLETMAQRLVALYADVAHRPGLAFV